MIIGLSGYAQSGKDESARHLVLAHEFTRVAFADKLKALALDLNPVVEFDRILGDTLTLKELVQFAGWEDAKKTPDVREFLQRLGQGVREHIDDYAWITAANEKVRNARGDVVITDVRYLNEIEYIIGVGGWLVRINRPDVGPVNDHITEHAWTNVQFDFVVENDGDVNDLGGKLDAIITLIHDAEGASRWT